MRLAVLSDTHGNATALEAVIQDLRGQSPDAVVFLGDMVMRGPSPSECIELVRSLNPLTVLRGNYDDLFTRFPRQGWEPKNHKEELILRAFEYDCERISVKDKEWLGNLPTGFHDVLNGVPTEMHHASSKSLIDIVYPWATLDELDTLHADNQTKLLLYGHIHHAYVRQGRGRLVVNCGSIGTPFDGDNRASYAIVDLMGSDIAVQLRRVTYDVEQAIAIAIERDMPDRESFAYALRTAQYPYNQVRQPSN
ncbi:metallophosphatase family protein [Paenibacillus sp. N1-5-1-14]|uniref:metallophosphoesterase family protein n=1 Tax=Paenibacillus radicibacter TaxID=2972488 RepID=UPI002159769E|nr:metallophosphoesterase family protein [Paenibacillus radicibacter]MCR8644624.1 metallophosphatase family protein [Paenibacillus radicibacter]